MKGPAVMFSNRRASLAAITREGRRATESESSMALTNAKTREDARWLTEP